MKRLWSFLILAVIQASSVAFAGVYEDMSNAVDLHDTGTVGDLLQRGVDVDTTDPEGTSLLMRAARNGDSSTLELLLRKRAKVLIRNKYGDSALLLAALRGHLRCVTLLVSAGAETDPEGWTPLIYAALEGHTEIVRFLLTLDIDIDAQAENGMTALMAASRNGHLEVVRILLEHDAAVGLVDQHNLTAIDLATRAGNREIADVLGRAGTH